MQLKIHHINGIIELKPISVINEEFIAKQLEEGTTVYIETQDGHTHFINLMNVIDIEVEKDNTPLKEMKTPNK